jgi:hypothetical protein
VLEGYRTPAEADEAARQRRQGVEVAAEGAEPVAGELGPGPELAAMTKREQLVHAFNAIGTVSAPDAVAWLMARGVRVSIRYAHEVAAKTHTPELRAVEAVEDRSA